MVGAGTMARAHSAALSNVAALYPGLALHPRLAAVADVDRSLASELAGRFGYGRVEQDWRRVLTDDVDLVVACLPPVLNREVVLAAAAAGKHVVCEKPLAESAAVAAELLRACRDAGVFHGLGAGYRWSPALRAIRELVVSGELGEIRSLRASFMLDYAADPDVPLLWRFRRSLAGGGIAIDTGYHLVDCARFLVGEIDSIQGLTTRAITERRLPSSGAIGNRGGGERGAADAMGAVDVEDAAAALVWFASGAYGILETSRVAIGKRVVPAGRALRVAWLGGLGSRAPRRVPRLPAGRGGHVRLPPCAGQPRAPGRDRAAHRWHRWHLDRLARPGVRDVGRVPDRDRRRPCRPRGLRRRRDRECGHRRALCVGRDRRPDAGAGAR